MGLTWLGSRESLLKSDIVIAQPPVVRWAAAFGLHHFDHIYSTNERKTPMMSYKVLHGGGSYSVVG